MTTAILAQDKKQIILAADTCGSTPMYGAPLCSKILKFGPNTYIAFAGSYLIRNFFIEKVKKTETFATEKKVVEISNELKHYLTNYKGSEEDPISSEVLIVTPTMGYSIGGDFSVYPVEKTNYLGIGSGQYLCSVIIEALEDNDNYKTLEAKVRRTMELTAKFSPSTGDDIDLVVVKKGKLRGKTTKPVS